MSWLPWQYLPVVELVRFKPVDFFPSPARWDELEAICIASKTRTIGDALLLSGLPQKLKARYPRLRVLTYIRAFNPVVFYANPHVSDVTYFPGRVFGDDCNLGSGHLIQLKEQYFDLPISPSPRPSLYLTESEERWAKHWLKDEDERPICVLHPWGHTWTNIAEPDYWSGLVTRHAQHWRFVQVGLQGHPPIAGKVEHFLVPKNPWYARKLFALMARAKAFIGVNSGPMHIARAFDKPSLILTRQGEPTQIFTHRRESPYFLQQNFKHGFLYEENQHLPWDLRTTNEIQQVTDNFLEKTQ